MKLLVFLLTLGLSGLGMAQTPAGAGASGGGAASAGTNVTGTVRNATTGKPLANSTVTLIRLQNEMQPVATTTADANGQYRFSQTSPGPYMVEADYQGIRYFAQVTAGQSETNVNVYNASSDAGLMMLDAEIMVLQPNGGRLAVVNEYRVENTAQPPRTLSQPQGMFRFRVPAGAQVDMVRVVPPSEMPISLPATPTSDHDVFGVNAALRPGETRIQVSYQIPYPALKAAVSETPVVHPAHFEVYVPSPMTFQGEGFVQVGEQDGYAVYGLPQGPVPATISFHVAGDAPMPNLPGASANDQTGGGSGEGAAAPESAASPAPAAVGPVPAPTFMERNRWTTLAILGLAAAAGFGMLLARKPAEPGPVMAWDAAASLPSAAAAAAASALPATAPAAALPAGPDLAAELSRLKDDLFLLEVQHHTGRLAEAEYARQRSALHARMDRLTERQG